MTSLTAKSLAQVLLRLWAVTLLVEVALAIPTFVSQFLGTGTPDASWRLVAGWTFVHVALTAIVAFSVFKFADPIADRLVQGSVESDPLTTMSFQAVAFGVLGAYFLIHGLRDSAGLLFQLATKPRYINENLSYLWEQSAGGLVGAVVQTVAGIALLLGRNGFVVAWQKIRGQAPDERA